jgi:predicted small secreted protein
MMKESSPMNVTHSRARTVLVALAVAAAAGTLAGCATLNTVSSNVSSFGEWPSGRTPGTYAFERLPSQEARAGEQTLIENAARSAIERAGFKAAASAASADVLVQLNARVVTEPGYHDDRWRPWPYVSVYGGRRVFWSVGAPIYHHVPRMDREVTVLLRDRASGKSLYETRAANSGSGSFDVALMAASFEAAMKDFPRPAVSPRRVDTELQPTLPTAGPTPAQQQLVK